MMLHNFPYHALKRVSSPCFVESIVCSSLGSGEYEETNAVIKRCM